MDPDLKPAGRETAPAPSPPRIPLAGWAGRELARLTVDTGSPAIATLTGGQLLGERAALNGFRVPGAVSAGGGCRLLAARNGWIALNLARDDDRDLLPALFGQAGLDPADDQAIAAQIAERDAADVVARGREMGLAIARSGETAASPAVSVLTQGSRGARAAHLSSPTRPPPPLVIDLSALWAGPLAGHLLWLAGANVVKVESPRRRDSMRDGDPALFALLNQGKASVALDPAEPEGRAALLALLARADMVIEATRPRALQQLGIDADVLVRARAPDHPLVWLTITGHGARGAAADWVGFGDDCAIAGGANEALIRGSATRQGGPQASGRVAFVGDAVADPLTGIRAAREGWAAWARGRSLRLGLAMSGVVAEALGYEQARARASLRADLGTWAVSEGAPFPAVAARPITGAVRPLAVDNAQWLTQ